MANHIVCLCCSRMEVNSDHITHTPFRCCLGTHHKYNSGCSGRSRDITDTDQETGSSTC